MTVVAPAPKDRNNCSGGVKHQSRNNCSARKHGGRIGRLISCAYTTAQILDESKTVTRRMKWLFLKVGDRLRAVEKGMGLKNGEKQRLLKIIEVTDVRREPLMMSTPADVAREGFPGMSAWDFVQKFCSINKGCTPSTEITRIEFKYVKE